MNLDNVFLAFLLTLFAGLSTGIGSFLALFTKRTNTKFLSLSLGFSAGVMIYISLVEIFAEAKDYLVEFLGDDVGNLIVVLSFFGGIAIIALIDYLLPCVENPHEIHRVEEMEAGNCKEFLQKFHFRERDGKRRRCRKKKFNCKRLMRMGIFMAIAIAIHNFPEGISTFIATLKEPTLGLAIAVAIAIHNIPEGIAVSVPVYFATGSRKKAFYYSFASGLAEPLGAVLAYFFLLPFMNDLVFGVMLAAVAGIMVFISLDELLPAAREYGEHHLSIYGLILGMGVMAVSLLLF